VLFFGGAGGIVYEADKGNKDGSNLIVADLQTAFNHLRSRGINKQFSVARALMLADGRAIPQLIINTDYDDTPPSALASAYVASGAQWNASTGTTAQLVGLAAADRRLDHGRRIRLVRGGAHAARAEQYAIDGRHHARAQRL
jgi:hypothetical protein